MDKGRLRVRFAPSPTGPLHIGGARSALFNWLLAKKHGGQFILRVEDTDLERSSAASEENIKEALRWLGLDWDEGADKGGEAGPYRQTERLAIYEEYTKKLLAAGKAYYCYCTDEELEQERKDLAARGQMPRYMGKCRDLSPDERARLKKQGKKPAVRFLVPPGQTVTVDDAVRGQVNFLSDGIGDFVIVKSDGVPTYNYAVVIDDALMAITHVIRGEEHLSNTPRQLLIYQGLGFTPPRFGHVSLILGKDRSKMSKRHGATSVEAYREAGYLPAGLLNFLALLGWSPAGQEEIFTPGELIERFSLESCAKGPAVFDPEKLNWINAQHIRQLPDDEFVAFARPYLAGFDLSGWEPERLSRVIVSAREHITFGSQLPGQLAVYLSKGLDMEEDALSALKNPEAGRVIALLRDKLAAAGDLTDAATKAMLKAIVKESALPAKAVYMPIRAALTGKGHGPELTQLIPLLGAARAIERIAAFSAAGGDNGA